MGIYSFILKEVLLHFSKSGKMNVYGRFCSTFLKSGKSGKSGKWKKMK
jgi:hypothetical protein